MSLNLMLLDLDLDLAIVLVLMLIDRLTVLLGASGIALVPACAGIPQCSGRAGAVFGEQLEQGALFGEEFSAADEMRNHCHQAWNRGNDSR